MAATNIGTPDGAGHGGDLTSGDVGLRVVNHVAPGAHVGYQSTGRVEGRTVIVGDVRPDDIAAVHQRAARLRDAATARGDVTATRTTTGNVIGIQAREIHNSRVHHLPANPAAGSTPGDVTPPHQNT